MENGTCEHRCEEEGSWPDIAEVAMSSKIAQTLCIQPPFLDVTAQRRIEQTLGHGRGTISD